MAGGVGNTQIIGGKGYTLYSPEWYAAMDEDKIHNAGVSGTAAGTFEGNALTATSPGLQGLYAAISSGMSGSGSGSGSSGGGSFSGGGSSPIASSPIQIAPTDMSAANASQFARAKDQVGQETSGALTGLRSTLASRGLLGSGSEGRATTSILTKGQGELGETSRQQAITGAETDQKNSEANLTAAVAQRGQDVAREGNQLRAQAEQANAQFAQRQTVLSGIMSALSGAIRSY